MRGLLILASAMVVIGGAMAPATAQTTPPPPAGHPAPPPPKKSFTDRLYYGGNVGLSFGTVDYVDIAPYLGVDLGHNLSSGVGVFYRHRNDDRYDPSLSTSDYGGSVFLRYRLTPLLFLHGEYDWTNFEYPLITGETTRDTYDAVLVGGGFAKPLGAHSAFIVQALYDLSWSDKDPAPYDNPWVFSAGVSVGF